MQLPIRELMPNHLPTKTLLKEQGVRNEEQGENKQSVGDLRQELSLLPQSARDEFSPKSSGLKHKKLQSAVAYINTYGSKHTDAIVTQENSVAEMFQDRVDAAKVLMI